MTKPKELRAAAALFAKAVEGVPNDASLVQNSQGNLLIFKDGEVVGEVTLRKLRVEMYKGKAAKLPA